ncbi:ATPase domain-containing protein [Halomicroarcula sp. GCM10025710]
MDIEALSKVPTGTPGLDDVLHGGVPEGQTTIVTGGLERGRPSSRCSSLPRANTACTSASKSGNGLRRNADALGIDLSNVTIRDLSPGGDVFFTDDSYTVFPSEEVDGEELIDQIATELEENDIDRLVIDPLSSSIRCSPTTSSSAGRSPRCSTHSPTVTSRPSAPRNRPRPPQRTTSSSSGRASSSPAHDRPPNARGDEVPRVRVRKRRSHVPDSLGHWRSGLSQLVPGDHQQEHDRSQLPSDVVGLDELLHGGIARGSVTVISGPSGVGKTTTGSQFLQAAASRGERSLLYLFEELRDDYLHRSSKLGMNVESLADAGDLEVEAVEALTQSPDEFATHVREAVEERDVEFVMLDGIVGYRQGLRGDESPDALAREPTPSVATSSGWA